MRLESLCFITFLAVVALSTTAVAQDFKPYPGSRVDEAAGRQASVATSGLQCEVYTSGDNFDKIYAFYKGLYREVRTPFLVQKLPNGEELKWAFFILDAGKDLSHSRYWLKIQRPYIDTIGDGDADFKDIRDVSAIQTVRKR
jgi:hypothetical protein